ncbi:hypothetical protein [Gordonia sp. CPCC 205333]|uniref:hypothetical protein n=1 Tax=Gordonia sp. CPCC 205333 TaxID=3140790 RepID=UPI003AF3B8B2
MILAAKAASVTLEAERVEQLGRTASAAGVTVGTLDFGGMRPTTASSETFAALGSCVTAATTTTRGVGARFSESGRSATTAATGLKQADNRGAVLLGAIF